MSIRIILAVLLAVPLLAAEHRVAYDDAGEPGRQPHLVAGENWHFDLPGDATPPLRSVAFGRTVRFCYAGLHPQAAYTVRLRFFADEDRSMRLLANGTALGDCRAEKGRTTVSSFAIPGAAYAQGTLTLSLERLTGPNAVVSEVEILSDDPTPLQAPPAPPAPTAPVLIPPPRLSPIPTRVAGCATTTVDLCGTWKFHPSPPADPAAYAPSGWSDIQVPGEWALQGFTVAPRTAAGYARTFTLPADWHGKRIHLRCDAVYSDAVVFINGSEAGRHRGGFTPFELDATSLVTPDGENTIALAVVNETDADRLSSGSSYACHPLGGIPRKLRLFALPTLSISSLQVTTSFAASGQDATLGVALQTAGEGQPAGHEVQILLSLTAPDGQQVPLAPDRIALTAQAGAVAIPIARPVTWDNEHPRLYTLTLRLEGDGQELETVVRRVGFRQIEVRGTELLVNQLPVKLRGSNHHEVYPTTGRSLPDGIHRRDIELFREGNVNHLRTCHYPPDEALLEAADELGMFIECEAPFCWAPGAGYEELVCRQTAEMVLAFRNHPCVLFWSIANESKWGPHFQASSLLIRQLDPTRPQVFNDCGSRSDPAFTDLLNFHYPHHGGPAAARKGLSQPVYLGEDCHLNAYNRLELATDPALRDLWGRYTREMWDDIQATRGCLGQSIWSGIDDTFYLPGELTVGYGTWGPIDGWRRPKPEYWGMKKAYSPVRILNGDALAVVEGAVLLSIENRQNFANLSEMALAWRCGDRSGTASADIPPGGKGRVRIGVGEAPRPGDRLELTCTDPRGFVADRFRLALGEGDPAPPATRPPASGRTTWEETADTITVTSGGVVWTIDRKLGQLATVDQLPLAGPRLMLLPLNKDGDTQMKGTTKVWTPFTEPCSGWTCASVGVRQEAEAVVVAIAGAYDNARGSYALAFRDGGLSASYSFTVTAAVNPRQVGLVFAVPPACETLAWRRHGYWDTYPDDHIARLIGRVSASEGVEATSVGPRTRPDHPWRLDRLPYGNNDFCSTKHDVIAATLTDAAGRGIAVDGQGRQHVRCWRTGTATSLLVADYSNGGSERFLHGLAVKDERPLKPGQGVAGTIRLSAVPAR